MSDRADGAVFLAKAIEEADRAGTLLPFSDREQASRDTLRDLGLTGERLRSEAGQRDLRRALRIRAEKLLSPLEHKYPVIDEILDRAHWPPWLSWGVLIGALALGLVLAALDGLHRIDILAFPFLGVIAWNVVVYLALLTAWLRRHAPTEPRTHWTSRTMMRSVARPLRALARRTSTVHTALGEAMAHFVTDWTARSGPLLAQRLHRLLHFGSASLAVGLLAGLYLRGVVLRYDAGWDSTFLSPEHVRRVIAIVYGVPSWVTGIALPATAAQVAELRWSAATPGVNAAPWIHLIAAALVLYVIVPRSLLAAAAGATEWRRRQAPWSQEMTAYARRALGATARGTTAYTVQVVPYAFEPDPSMLDRLKLALESRLQGNVLLESRATLAYGDEAEAAARFLAPEGRSFDANVLLLNLAATPEAENHGATLKAIREQTERARSAPLLVVALDESAFATRFSRGGALAHRLDERRSLWREFVAGYGLEAWFVDLGAGAPVDVPLAPA
jgi:hypothetical protein